MNKNIEIATLINEMLGYCRLNNCFTSESVDELILLADFANEEVGKLINKFHYINTKIVDSGGIPVLKQVLEMVSGTNNDNCAAACDSNIPKANPWVWTELAENLKPDRKAGETVPVGYLFEGYSEYYPYRSWIRNGYVKRNEQQKVESAC
ncbi:hypothetical protein BRE01_62580 [Brevibacillus reuszeri]|uniref:Uncharacterized protein n=1 Tax=Brevibacillus reuszeri TaxID=54915 RepID=A0A0K9YW98_9BACL|nr:hypothetical protein [Brevibacillus reuszeri]KNB72946.1 hypothetical protein ADS79_14065 [Brevibacillus reuszeri]GED72556.1 hypothetical protein BRE01_62580 [Brevibacillus reuszeri]